MKVSVTFDTDKYQLTLKEPTMEMVQASGQGPQMKIVNGIVGLHSIRTGSTIEGLGLTEETSATAESFRSMLNYQLLELTAPNGFPEGVLPALSSEDIAKAVFQSGGTMRNFVQTSGIMMKLGKDYFTACGYPPGEQSPHEILPDGKVSWMQIAEIMKKFNRAGRHYLPSFINEIQKLFPIEVHAAFEEECKAIISGTFAMIKPDATKRGIDDEIIEFIEANGFKVEHQQKETLNSEEAGWLYQEHKDKPHFKDLVDFTISGPVVHLCLSTTGTDAVAKFRKLMGPTEMAPLDTIRGKFGLSQRENSIHGSDSDEAASAELKHFLNITTKNPIVLG